MILLAMEKFHRNTQIETSNGMGQVQGSPRGGTFAKHDTVKVVVIENTPDAFASASKIAVRDTSGRDDVIFPAVQSSWTGCW